jgi:hypothetical protein
MELDELKGQIEQLADQRRTLLEEQRKLEDKALGIELQESFDALVKEFTENGATFQSSQLAYAFCNALDKGRLGPR